MINVNEAELRKAVEISEEFSDDFLRGYQRGIKDTIDTIREEITPQVSGFLDELDAASDAVDTVIERRNGK